MAASTGPVHVTYCHGCQNTWAETSHAQPGPQDDCACTCTDPANPLYEAWHTIPVTLTAADHATT